MAAAAAMTSAPAVEPTRIHFLEGARRAFCDRGVPAMVARGVMAETAAFMTVEAELVPAATSFFSCSPCVRGSGRGGSRLTATSSNCVGLLTRLTKVAGGYAPAASAGSAPGR